MGFAYSSTAKLVRMNGNSYDHFGFATAMSGDTAIITLGQIDDRAQAA